MKLQNIFFIMLIGLFVSCGGKEKKAPSYGKSAVKKEVVEKVDNTKPSLDNKGIGPIKSLKLEAINDALVTKGKAIYKTNCTACHKFSKRYIGPGLKGITERRSPEWIMNLILNTEEMLAKDPVAKALIAEYNAPMANQQLSEEDARAILEYFRTKN
jgi:mono/diheme cytochrome c family protein